jgi:threonine dehydratase
MSINLPQIQGARERIRKYVQYSPCTHFESLSDLTGAHVYTKLENLQTTGSFKVRGALNALLQLSDEEKAAGVVAASAGNHAQAVAYGARLLGIQATIVMPETTPLTKIEGTRSFGAHIELAGLNYDAAYTKALDIQQKQGCTLIHAFDDPRVIAGQGSIGLELLEQLPEVDMVVVPVGGGGLIAGIATAIKEQRPQVQIIGVEAKRLPAMQQSLAANHVTALRPNSTMADGIAVAEVGRHTLPLVQRYVSGMVTVSEDDIAHAVLSLLEHEKTLAEGAGAVGVAALRCEKIDAIQGKTIAVIISGGNMDMTQLAVILERGLEAEHRLAQLKLVVPDSAASISDLTLLLTEQQAKILQMSSNHPFGEVEMGEVELHLTLETRGREHLEAITAAITEKGITLL